ncbi:NfeD family protein [Alginatibacterium sediminis]|uniref:NfeD family protein n=1 Tax=Alginatibacterium sediminis TaxID=2164068 RepID=A0A420EJR1_9ALTE|nr:NfeD family protein [Alginatibacterium sediminis]RKF20903.1 NfeD family protein [Alginatibacterium sediminis]
MASFWADYIPQILVAAGIFLIIIEVAVIGFATFILLFLGLSLMITGSLIWVDILPDSWNSILLANALCTSVLALVLWKPLRKLQNQTDTSPVTSDFDGHQFFCEHDIDKRGKSEYSYSGVKWALKSESAISAGTEVVVVRAEVGVLWVKAL